VEITSSPGFRSFIIASMAANPDPKASPYLPFSMLAKASSKAFLVGL